MQTITVEITDGRGLKAIHALQEKQSIRIVEEVNFDTPSVPGIPMALKAFKAWIDHAENMPVVKLKEAKAKWAVQRKQLQKITK